MERFFSPALNKSCWPIHRVWFKVKDIYVIERQESIRDTHSLSSPRGIGFGSGSSSSCTSRNASNRFDDLDCEWQTNSHPFHSRGTGPLFSSRDMCTSTYRRSLFPPWLIETSHVSLFARFALFDSCRTTALDSNLWWMFSSFAFEWSWDLSCSLSWTTWTDRSENLQWVVLRTIDFDSNLVSDCSLRRSLRSGSTGCRTEDLISIARHLRTITSVFTASVATGHEWFADEQIENLSRENSSSYTRKRTWFVERRAFEYTDRFGSIRTHDGFLSTARTANTDTDEWADYPQSPTIDPSSAIESSGSEPFDSAYGGRFGRCR